MLTAARIVEIAPAAARYADELVQQMAESGIMANPMRAAMFLGQIHHESRGFSAVVESMSYRPERLLEVFGGRNGGLHTLADAKALLAKGPKAVADFVYGGAFGAKQLGNTEPGDGSRFIGRGLKQLTGRDNYRRFSRAWQGDEIVLANPQRVAEPDGAVASAVWFWLSKGLNQVADRGDVKAVARLVNGGSLGLAERVASTERYRRAWADFRHVRSSVTSTEERA